MRKTSTPHLILLVILTMTSGCVDAISFLSLGQVFTAAMTGNTVLFGLSLEHANGLVSINYLIALLGFVGGAAIGAVVLSKNRKQSGWTSAVTMTLLIELAVLVLFGLLVTALHVGNSTSPILKPLLILVLAIAMGVQGVAARRVGVNGVTTTVITSTLTGLVESVVWKLGDRVTVSPNQAKTGGTEQGVTRSEGDTTPIYSIVMWISVIVFYGVGASLCGLLLKQVQWQAAWLPVFLVAVVISVDLVHRRSIQRIKSRSADISGYVD